MYFVQLHGDDECLPVDKSVLSGRRTYPRKEVFNLYLCVYARDEVEVFTEVQRLVQSEKKVVTLLISEVSI